MPVIQFRFADPTPDGDDAPAGERVRCALLEPEAVTGVYRSVAEFQVPLVAGAADATLSAGAWYIAVDGVEGISERWVLVPSGAGPVLFTALPDVDLSTVPVQPVQVPRWSALDGRLSVLEQAGAEVSLETDPAVPGSVVLVVAPRATPAAPVVVQQPASLTRVAGAVAVFTASASGTPAPTVQWQINGGAWADIAGATSASYTIPSVAVADDGKQYRAIFTNASGSVATQAATLTVTASGGGGGSAPVVTTQPQSQTVASGASLTLTAAATGATSMQWYTSLDNGATWKTIAGATDTTYAGTVFAGGPSPRFRATFTNTSGSVTTDAAIITVTGD
ncbi:hypothetical protein [Microbacterium sp. 5K110]|jgi:hypothetical protein|uniref:hypothetical protein n=1 Tax=unclassified Microbacterium TaxID=2609290 RepID=UPI0010FE6EF3|nr:hypothetical protein [Microbacterium sp. 5K110]TLF33970.1 hypothetical protein FE256_02325 [Microbacterium sp. 5K110]